jgi:hypothetical protein
VDRKSDRQEAVMVTLPTRDRNIEGASFNPTRVIEAVEFLEIREPVEIKWSGGTRTIGTHRWRDGKHLVTVSTYLPAEKLSAVLWHELTHAQQQERFGGPTDWYREYSAENRTRGYRQNRFEIEARENAEVYGSEMRLTN